MGTCRDRRGRAVTIVVVCVLAVFLSVLARPASAFAAFTKTATAAEKLTAAVVGPPTGLFASVTCVPSKQLTVTWTPPVNVKVTSYQIWETRNGSGRFFVQSVSGNLTSTTFPISSTTHSVIIQTVASTWTSVDSVPSNTVTC